MVSTTLGEMDEGQLQRHDGLLDNEDERTTWVEYCLSDCAGEAHRTGKSDNYPVFCSQHIHRSVHVMLKKPVTIEGVAASFG